MTNLTNSDQFQFLVLNHFGLSLQRMGSTLYLPEEILSQLSNIICSGTILRCQKTAIMQGLQIWALLMKDFVPS